MPFASTPHTELKNAAHAVMMTSALHAHKSLQLVVQWDIKPGNILPDRNGEPFGTDFGLALQEQDIGKGPRCAGSPACVSPVR
jgi:serine/threonine protein kinase